MPTFEVTEQGTFKTWFSVGDSHTIVFQITDEGIIVDIFDEIGDLVNTFAATADEFAEMVFEPEEDKNVRTPVWILTINSRYGTSRSAHSTEESAKGFLKKWVDDMWDLCAGIPYSVDKAVEEYFFFFAGESFDLTYTEMIY
jgi:hypothetical protein